MNEKEITDYIKRFNTQIHKLSVSQDDLKKKAHEALKEGAVVDVQINALKLKVKELTLELQNLNAEVDGAEYADSLEMEA